MDIFKQKLLITKNISMLNHLLRKPNQTNAENYLKSGSFFWNSGMFIFKASKFLDEMQKFEPKILSYCKESIKNVNKDEDFIRHQK